jgi:hypothetical protein
MAQDIVPIQLALTKGDVVTLWAPRWREDGDEWEAFLGRGDELYVFPDAAQLAAFVRTSTDHDLIDHPAWRIVPRLSVEELVPDQTHRYDLVGVPELVAGDADTWAVGDLADVIAMVRSLADVCELAAVHDVLDAADGFAMLDQGPLVFTGRDGERLWTEIGAVVAQRWDEVLDALDAVVTTPDVDSRALAEAERELAAARAGADEVSEEDHVPEVDQPVERPGFWAQVGIDPIRIVTPLGDHYTLRCYVDDEPVFLGSKGTIEVFRWPRALAKYLASDQGATGHDLAEVSTWDDVVTAAAAGELKVQVEPDNTYVLTGLPDDLAGGPEEVDPTQLDLAVELITDAARWAGDDSADAALAPSESLGWLVSFVLRPDPTRLAPSPPFDAEVAAWKRLTNDFTDRLHLN